MQKNRNKLSRRIKLIWDFRGPDAHEIAVHHEKHLSEYMQLEKLEGLTGHQDYSQAHSMAYVVVMETDMIKVRDALIPHRGEVYQESTG